MENTLLYSCLHKKLCEKFGPNRTINKQDVYRFLRVHYLIPKNIIPPLIKEMEINGLIINLSQKNIIVNPVVQDLEKNINKIYMRMNIF